MIQFKYILFFFIAGQICVFSQSDIVSEDILITNDSIKLPGTLTYNTKLKKQPLAIFIPGSGNPDRNGNQPQFGVNSAYIKQLSQALNEKGIAFFRYDKRNGTKENIKHILKSYVFQDLVDDVKAVKDKFVNDDRFSEIILIGHSQGSLVAMIAVDDKVSKYISLAGLGESADKTIIRQVTAQNEQLGEMAKAHIKELMETKTIKTVNPMLASLFAKLNHEFLLSYLTLDPREEIKKIRIPILILNGDKDIQVKKGDAVNLHEANPESQMVIIKNMNHVLKKIENEEDNLKSYYAPNFPLSEKLVEVISAFIVN